MDLTLNHYQGNISSSLTSLHTDQEGQKVVVAYTAFWLCTTVHIEVLDCHDE